MRAARPDLRGWEEATPKFAIELDIKKCFDTIDHDFIINNVGIQKVGDQLIQVIHPDFLKEWLKSGYVDILGLFSPKKQIVQTLTGIPQGGPISPCISNITLNGIEHAVKSISTKTTKFDKLHIKPEDKIVWRCNDKDMLCTFGLDLNN